MSELQSKTLLVWNPILRRYLVNAPHRMNRREGVVACPFCADITEGKVGAGTQVWLHPNDFPPLQPPVGEAYVVIYSRDHDRAFVQLTADEVSAVTHLWHDLYCDLASRYAAVMIFENSGEAIGQTQFHPHGQAFGVSVIPAVLERELETVVQDAAAGEGCPFCRVRGELDGGPYEVAANRSWQAFLPPYAGSPYETHLYPRRHVANLGGMGDDELDDLAAILLEVVRGYNGLFEGAMAPMPYLLGLHQLADERFHLHVEILTMGRAPGKLKHAASAESLWGFWTNDSLPVQKAEELREAIGKMGEPKDVALSQTHLGTMNRKGQTPGKHKAPSPHPASPCHYILSDPAPQSFPLPASEAMEKFPIAFDDGAVYRGPLGAVWASGRVNLMGEHTDYNDGFVLPLAVERVAAFAGRGRGDGVVRLWSTHFEQYAQFSLGGLPGTFELQRDGLPGWARYVLAVATELMRMGIVLAGFDAVVAGDVPLGGGMSSSAALEVATARACALFSGGAHGRDSSRPYGGGDGATLTPLEVAVLCQRAEYAACGVRCGILDQAASCLGRAGEAILLDCRSLAYRYLPFDAVGLSLVVIDTGVRRELAASLYNERRRECEEAVLLLRDVMMRDEPENEVVQAIRALRDVTMEQFGRYGCYLPEVLRRRVGYVVAEVERVLQAVKLLEMGDIEAMGPLLWRSHAGLRDEYEVSCVELDTLVEIARGVPGVLGGRMMGGGFGGCTVNLVRTGAVEALHEAVEELYPVRTGLRAVFDVCL